MVDKTETKEQNQTKPNQQLKLRWVMLGILAVLAMWALSSWLF